MWPYHLLLNYWQLTDYRRGRGIISSCGLTGELTRLCCIVSNTWSHRWPSLKLVGHKTSQKTMNMKKRCREKDGGLVGVRGR